MKLRVYSQSWCGRAKCVFCMDTYMVRDTWKVLSGVGMRMEFFGHEGICGNYLRQTFMVFSSSIFRRNVMRFT